MSDSQTRIDDMIRQRLTLILTEADVRQVLPLDRHLIDLMDQAFIEFSAATAVIPPRTPLVVAQFGGRAKFMPGWVPGQLAFGCKVVTGYDHNPQLQGLPSTLGSLVLLDPRSGFPIAYMGSTFLTNARTAAAAAAAGRALARPDSCRIGIYGSGVLARLVLTALTQVLPVSSALVYSRSADNRNAYATEMSARLGLPVQATDDQQAPAVADVIVVATVSRTPAFDGAWVKPGTTVLSVGSGGAVSAEIPVNIIKGNKLTVESRAAALKEIGEVVLPIQRGELTEQDVYAELGEILLGKLPGRERADEILVYKSIGLATQDMITARAVYEAALVQGVGQAIAIQSALD